MRPLTLLVTIVFSGVLAARCQASYFDDDSQTSHQLTLADLASYRAALSGKPTADSARSSDLPVETKFKDLWNRPDALRGRRVSVHGRVARIFRQGPVGSFPALAEVWMSSPAGDPFCVVFPQPGPTDLDNSLERHSDAGQGIAIPEIGQMVRFTGTFLKMVRYAGGDGPRLGAVDRGRPTASAGCAQARRRPFSPGKGHACK